MTVATQPKPKNSIVKTLGILGTLAVGGILALSAAAPVQDVNLADGQNVIVNCSAVPVLTWTNSTHHNVRVSCPSALPTASPSPTPTPTTASVSPTSTPIPTVTPTASPTPTPTVTPTPTPSSGVASMYANIYGAGVESDSKDNWQVGWSSRQKVDFRFRSSGGVVSFIAVNARGGTGYSGGNGGQITATIRPDDGTGKPNESIALGAVTWSPGNPGGDWENKSRHAFPATTLNAGTLYHIVFTNPSATQTTNYVSLNVMTVLSGQSATQPAYTSDFDVLNNRGSWASVHETPVFDLTYTNGKHDGNGYYQITVTTPPSDPTQTILSGTSQARERFTPKVDVTVNSMALRVKRLSGTSPLVLTLQGGGITIPVSIDGTGVPISTAPNPSGSNHWDAASLSGGRWLKGSFPATVLKAGTEYTFKASTNSNTQYMAIPLRAVNNEVSPAWGSRNFDDGVAERTANGTNWTATYPDGNHDWQFYFGK